MNEPADPTPANAGQSPVAPLTSTKRRHRVPIWLRLVGGMVLVLVLLVVFAPTIAGTGPVRSYVLGKVNADLNGRVEVADWSLGWLSGVKVSGVRVTDAGGAEMLTLATLTTDLTVLDLVRGQYTLGDAVVDGLDVKVRREADGELNLVKLTKAKADQSPPAPSEPKPEPRPRPSPAPTKSEPRKLPDLSGRLVIRNSRGTFEDLAKKQVVQFPRIEGSADIPSINDPVAHEFVVDAVTGGEKGTFRLKGTADVVQENELRIESASVDEIINLESLDLAAVAAFLPPGGIEQLRGKTFAGVTVKAVPGQSAVVSVDVRTDNLAVSGPALKGDTFRARQVSFSVPPTTIDTSPGFDTAWAIRPIRTGGDKPQPIAVVVKHEGYEDVVELGVNATPQALMNVADNEKPGAVGEVTLRTMLNVGGLAKQLPNVFTAQEGRRLNSGQLEQSATITLTPDTASIQQSLDLKSLAITNTTGGVEQLQPVRQELRFNSRGGGWAMPDLRDVRLALDSGFAKVELAGKELTQLKGTADGDLAKARRDLGPVLPALAAMNLAGTFHAEVNAAGDVTSATAPIDLSLLATLTGIRVNDVAVEHARVEAGAKVIRTDAGIDALNGVRLAARAGRSEREAPTVDALVTADVKYRQTGAERVAEVPGYKIERLNVDLAAAQRDFAPGGDYLIQSGKVAFTGSGSHAAAGTTFAAKGGVTGLNLLQATAPVLRDYALTLDTAGTLAPDGTRVTRLNISDNQGVLTVRQGQGDIVIPASGATPPSGELVLGADLKKLLELSGAAKGTAAPAAAGPQLQSGRVDGTLRLAAAPGPENLIALTGQLDASGLTVRTPDGQPVKDERLRLKPTVRLNRDFSVFNVDFIGVEGRLINGRIFDTIVDTTSTGAPLAAVRKANAVFDLPQLGDLHALVLALSPPAPSEAGEPGRIRGGSATLRATLGQQGDAIVITPELDVTALSLGTAKVSRSVGDVTIRSTVQMAGADSLSVPTLTIKGAGADVRLEKPIVIKNLSAASPEMSALLSGRINLAELCAALEAWEGAEPGTAYPYAGDVTLRQELTTSSPGGVISLIGSAGVKQFATTGKDAGGRFAEPEVSFVNELKFDPNAKVLTLDRLAFATETTGAARMLAKGTVRDYDTARRFDKLTIDLDYDAAALWAVLRPLMDPETGGASLEEFAMAGKRKQSLEVTGSYPVNDPHAIRQLRATGGFGLDALSGRGLTVAQLDLRFLLDQGILKLEHTTNAAPPTTSPIAENLPPGALCNDSGVISFHNVAVDLTGDHPRLRIPDNHPLIRGVSINPVVADTLIGRFVNPAFNNATQARGILNVTVVSCRGLALDKAMQSSNPRESGRAELRWSLDDLFLSQPEVIELIAKLKPNALNENGVAGAVRDGRVVIEAGQVQSDMIFAVDKYALKFKGGIGLAEGALANYFVTLPPELFAAIDKSFARHVPPQGYRVALSGTTNNWSKSVADSLLPIVADLGVRAGLGSVLDRALGGRDDDKDRDRERERRPRDADDRPAAQPQPQPARETDAEKAARREQAREERRIREEKEAAERAAKRAAATQPTTAPTDEKPLTKRERERLRQEERRREKEQREQERKQQQGKKR